ncbi:hypothetical protein HHK36_022654 [Tetracentron sinense]|uniref:CCHC-type domain-containing protein n=1 Tax=Tetracentron sinense TaxID=13715 RepID=A0A835D920_TETSI|nr:hypothetical protein HHK36_022654 [Tetracentron sinense]
MAHDEYQSRLMIASFRENLALPNDQQVVEIEDALLEEGRIDCRFSIIGRFATEKSLNGNAATRTTVKAWKTKVEARVQTLKDNCFLFKFAEERDILKVLYNQPWSFDGNLLVMKRWSAELTHSNVTLNIVPFWIQLHDIPPDMFTYKIIQRIAADLGEVDEIDFQQGGPHQGSFIRTRVFVDISKPLKGWLPVIQKTSHKATIVEVKYERLPNFCFHCGLIGHAERYCEDSPVLMREEREVRAQFPREFGPWLKAERKETRPYAGKEDLERRLKRFLVEKGLATEGGSSSHQGRSMPETLVVETGESMAVENSDAAHNNGGLQPGDDDGQRVTRATTIQPLIANDRRAHLTRHLPDSPRTPAPLPKRQVCHQEYACPPTIIPPQPTPPRPISSQVFFPPLPLLPPLSHSPFHTWPSTNPSGPSAVPPPSVALSLLSQDTDGPPSLLSTGTTCFFTQKEEPCSVNQTPPEGPTFTTYSPPLAHNLNPPACTPHEPSHIIPPNSNAAQTQPISLHTPSPSKRKSPKVKPLRISPYSPSKPISGGSEGKPRKSVAVLNVEDEVEWVSVEIAEVEKMSVILLSPKRLDTMDFVNPMVEVDLLQFMGLHCKAYKLHPLKHRKNDVKAKLEQVILQHMRPKEEVQFWIKSIEAIESQVNEIVKEVCGRMETQKKIKIECLLGWNEAWDLFQKMVGEETLNSHLEIPKLVEVVGKEYCAGLPLALIAIGRTMASKKTPYEWNHAITVLRKSASEFSGMGDEVLPLLKFSYDNLPNATIKACFLYCSLYPEDYNIIKDDLIEHWIGEGFIMEFDDMNEACYQGHDIIGTLKLNEAHQVEKWELAERISPMENDISAPTESPTWPNLVTLLLERNKRLKTISNGFFKSMTGLRVLDFSDTPIKEFPMEILKLIELQYLNLSITLIFTLPGELKILMKLKYLNLRNTFNMQHIPFIVYSRLPRLQGLNRYHINTDDIKLGDTGGPKFKKQECWVEDSLGELECLKHLKVLGITIITIPDLQRLFTS